MFVYSTFGGMEFLTSNQDLRMGLALRTSMGNMGFSGAVCSLGPIDLNKASSNLTF